MSDYRGKRSYQNSPYHYDMRYGTREHLSELEWQRGILSVEHDDMLIGDREAMISRVLSNPSDELLPDRKISEPSLPNVDEIMF